MTHRLVRGVAGAMPQGARCVELRLKPQLKANLPRWSVPIGRTRLCRGAADAPVCSGRGWSHAPGGWVCRAAAEAAAQSELGQCPQGGRGGRRRQCRGAADTPVCSGRGGSHAPGGSVCRAAAEAAARSRSSKRACVAHQQLPSDWSRAALPVLEVVPLASQARSARSARAAGRAPARWPGVGCDAFQKAKSAHSGGGTCLVAFRATWLTDCSRVSIMSRTFSTLFCSTLQRWPTCADI